MTYRVLADLLVVFHFAFILFALFGGLIGIWRKWAMILHLPAAIWIALTAIQGWICPLTPLENRLRMLGGEAGYDAGFVEHYLIPIIYPSNLNHKMQVLLGLAAIFINVCVYCFVIFRNGKAKKTQ